MNLIAEKGRYRVIRDAFRGPREYYFVQRFDGLGDESKVHIKTFCFKADALEFLNKIAVWTA